MVNSSLIAEHSVIKRSRGPAGLWVKYKNVMDSDSAKMDGLNVLDRSVFFQSVTNKILAAAQA